MVQKNPNFVDLDQTLVSEPLIDQKLLDLPEIDQSLVFESAIDTTRGDELGMNKTLVYLPEKEQTLVTESAIEETVVTEPGSDQTRVTESTIEETLVTNSAIAQTLPEEQTMNQNLDMESEHGWDRDSIDTISNSSFKSIGEEKEALGEDYCESDTWHDAQAPVEGDDVDHDEPELSPVEPKCKAEISSWLSSWDRNEKEEKRSGFSWGRSSFDDENPAMVGAGLYNLGNTCFLNAILQCFTHTVPLIEGLRSYNHPKPCERDIEGFCVFCALHNHIEVAITKKESSLSPLRIVENLNQLSSGFQRYQQEDAHELLQCLLDKLDTCCNSSKIDDSDESLVHRLFGGRLVSKLKCCNCGHCSDTFESLIDLSLEIENVGSLDSALESFTKVEKIEDEEPQFTCESCKEKVTVEKQLMVDHAPSIAAFHLKRFKNVGSRVEKIDTHVEFPLELDLKPYTSSGRNDNVDLSYSLYAIVVHSGFSPTSGHYFCFIRSAPDAWYRLDDSQVTRVSEFQVLSRDAYILLYAKNGTPWFSTFMGTEKLTMDSYVSSPSPKSVLENAKQSSESSPGMEANNISEVNDEDRREATETSGLSCNSSRQENEISVAKVDSTFDKKLFPSVCKGDKLVISSSLLESIINKTNHVPIMETNIFCDVDEEDRDDAMEISRFSCGQRDGIDEGKSDCKDERSLCLPAIRDDNGSQKDSEFTKNDDFKSSTSQRISSPIKASRLSFDDYTPEDVVDGAKGGSKVEKKLSRSARRGEVAKGVDVNSSGLAFSAKPCSTPRDHVMTERELPCKRQSSDDRGRKEACKQLKRTPGSKRRSQLLAIVNNDRDISLNNIKKTKVNAPSSNIKDGPSNSLHNRNLVSLRRAVAPGR